MWIKALLAVAPAALYIAGPAPVYADGACTALANNVDAYTACVNKMNVPCERRPSDFWRTHNLTCTYPNGGRDDCVLHFVPFSIGQVSDFTCTYVPPGSESAPALGAEPS